MHYCEMNPSLIRDAIAQKVPVILPIGTLEFHSEHLPVGTDGMNAEGIAKRVDARHPEIVLLPTFYYGTASYAVAGPENGQGTISIDSMNVCRFAEDLFTNLLEVGFRNIHGIIYHQTENFTQGMPTDLAFRFAGCRAIFAFLERTMGRGWWGSPKMKEYYRDPESNFFDWIQVHTTSEEFQRKNPGDHAGKVETSEIMELHPDLVRMEKLTDQVIDRDWFAADAREATREYGKRRLDEAVEDLEKLLKL